VVVSDIDQPATHFGKSAAGKGVRFSLRAEHLAKRNLGQVRRRASEAGRLALKLNHQGLKNGRDVKTPCPFLT
jgi:hypothetical protein